MGSGGPLFKRNLRQEPGLRNWQEFWMTVGVWGPGQLPPLTGAGIAENHGLGSPPWIGGELRPRSKGFIQGQTNEEFSAELGQPLMSPAFIATIKPAQVHHSRREALGLVEDPHHCSGTRPLPFKSLKSLPRRELPTRNPQMPFLPGSPSTLSAMCRVGLLLAVHGQRKTCHTTPCAPAL